MSPRKARVEAKPPRRRNLGVRAVDALIANPVGTGGGLVMMAMASAILVNALAMQPGIHPAPLFQNTRPVAVDAAPTQALPGAAATGDDIDDILTRTTGRPSSVDSGLVAEIQTELKRLGYYDGTIDGLTGPMTSTAVLAFEKDHGLQPTGNPSGDVLAALRAGGRPAPSTPMPAAPMPTDPAPAALAEEAPAETTVLPRPRPRTDQRAAAADPMPADPIAALLPVAEAADPLVTAAVTAAPPAERADPRLAKIQESLDLLGFGPLKPDGRWSPDTRAAIKRFEAYRGLPLTGELNETVVAELIRIGGLSLD